MEITRLLENEIYPALFAHLDAAFPEFGFRRRGRAWQASEESATRRLPGSPRPDRVMVYENSSFGMVIQGGGFVPFLEYVSGIPSPRGRDFVDAARRLAEKAAVDFPEYQLTPRQKREIASKEKTSKILESFISFARQKLQEACGAKARAYLHGRGFGDEQIKELSFGYYPTPQEVSFFLLEKGFTREEIGLPQHQLEKNQSPGTGLIFNASWQGRLVCPWRDRGGRIVNVWARDVSRRCEDQYKYLMLKGSKKDAPFNIDRARLTDLVVVEGFMDALTPYAHGMDNVVAVGGAHLTEGQEKYLLGLPIGRLTLNFDYDPGGAGRRGMMRTVSKLAKRAKFRVYAVDPERMAGDDRGEKVDPDTYVRRHGIDAYRSLVEGAERGTQLYARAVMEPHDMSTAKGRDVVIDSLMRYSESVHDPLEREDLTRLLSEATGYAPDNLRRMMEERQEKEEEKEVSEVLAPEEISPPEKSVMEEMREHCSMEDVYDEIKKMPNKTVLIVEAGTGTGKTYTMLRAMKYLQENTRSATTILCPTIVEAERAIGMLKGLGTYSHLLSLVVSPRSSNSEETYDAEDDEDPGAETARNLTASTYGYLGRNGERDGMYVGKLKDLLQHRTVFCDEVHTLFNIGFLMYPLLTRYKKVGEGERPHYQQLAKCPRKAGNGNCANCELYGDRMEPHGHEGRRDFYQRLPRLEDTWPKLGLCEWEDVQDPSNYEHIAGTLFMSATDKLKIKKREDLDWGQEIKDEVLAASKLLIVNEAKKRKEEKEKRQTKCTSLAGYLQYLSKSLESPHYRVEYPVVQEGEVCRPIDPESVSGGEIAEHEVTFPRQKCKVPHLCGFDKIALLQLFSLANKLIFSTATMPEEFREIIGQVAENLGWDVKELTVGYVPYKFKVTLLKTGRRIGLVQTMNILRHIDGVLDSETFVVTATKAESNKLYALCRGRIEGVVHFMKRDYYWGESYRRRTEKAEQTRHLLAYAWAAITKGVDMPHKDILLVDCSHFLPRAATFAISPENSPEENKKKMLEIVEFNVAQIVGRLLRSDLPRRKGESVIDERRIVVVLHGLPKELEDLTVNPELLAPDSHVYQEFFIGNDITKDTADAIVAAARGIKPADRAEEKRRRLEEIAERDGIKKLSSKQRRTVKKDKKLRQRIQQMKREGLSWSEIYLKLHLARKPEDVRQKLKDEYESYKFDN